MPLPQTQISVIDALGAVQQSLADLRSREIRLIGQIGRMGVGYHAGRLYTATVAAVIGERGGVQVTVRRNEPISRRPSGRARAVNRAR
jgi:hypothetical protein